MSRNKKWFDKDCEKAKKELTAALKNLNIYPKDPIVRGKYHKMKKEYKQLIKKTEHKFKEEMLQKISQLESTQPEVFWDMVNKLRNKKNCSITDNIEPEEWYEWFKQLNRAPNIPDSFDKTIQNIITRVKDFTLPNNLLDGEVLNKEIIKAAKKLKNGKAVGSDIISNEMIKCLVHTKVC